MIATETLQESVLRNEKADKKRMHAYKLFSVAFSYPDKSFFALFPALKKEKETILLEYDTLFRAKHIWLYTTEFQAKHDFQKSRMLADIMGFYRAFGVLPDRERPDAVSAEFEFMHYLIFKKIYSIEKKLEGFREKAEICINAQKKFFNTHLYPGAKVIMQKILSHKTKNFYNEIAREALSFLEDEKRENCLKDS
ncbi:MAG: molecular chaperone TorD family protein [Omnitrophica bacterium]|nr:molecular chaperone TorD family protein [Candidatus Omnitrophota bacterium]